MGAPKSTAHGGGGRGVGPNRNASNGQIKPKSRIFHTDTAHRHSTRSQHPDTANGHSTRTQHTDTAHGHRAVKIKPKPRIPISVVADTRIMSPLSTSSGPVFEVT